MKENPVTTEIIGNYRDGGTISPSKVLPDGSSYEVVIKPNPGFQVKPGSITFTGGTLIDHGDGTYTIVFDHVIKAEEVNVAFEKIEAPAEKAPVTSTPTGDTTPILPFTGMLVRSLVACGLMLKKRKAIKK